jgi:diaminohydroxyphosphoribosylaminopyrimidine deaminase/5-amino-6-(5-phosphoribosylamino)uracil reductase
LLRRRRLLRVILDSKLRLSPKSRIVQTADDDLIVFTAAPLDSIKARRLQKEGVELIRVRATRGRIDLNAVLAELGRREILSLLLEAGPTLNGAALSAGLVHKLRLFYAPKFAGDVGVPFAHMSTVAHGPLPNVRVEQFGPDVAIEVYLHDVYRK